MDTLDKSKESRKRSILCARLLQNANQPWQDIDVLCSSPAYILTIKGTKRGRFAWNNFMTWRVKGLYVQIRRGILSSCWHLKSESPPVSGISMKEASRGLTTIQQSFVLILGENCASAGLVQFITMQDSSPDACRRWWWGHNSRNISVLVTYHFVVKIGLVHIANVITHRSLRIYRSPQTRLLLWTFQLHLITTSNALIFQEVAIPQGVWIICGH